jgi:rSAM/selenodomain-associated transferase 2
MSEQDAGKRGSGATVPQCLSVVIPTLNAAQELPVSLAALAEGREAGFLREVIVADCGSGDGTRQVAEALGARVVEAPRGRGAQLAAGAAAAAGDWLFFLHADTRPAPGWGGAVTSFIADARNQGGAGYLRFRLDDPSPPARRVETLVGWRCRRLGLPYGDQGLLLSAALYRDVGGFRPLPLMEDVDLIRRIGRRRLIELPIEATTSAARYRRDGYWARPARNLACLALYFAGVPLRLVTWLYA